MPLIAWRSLLSRPIPHGSNSGRGAGNGVAARSQLGTYQPILVYKALAHLVNEVYVKGTTKNRLDSTESEEAWALAQLLSEYRDLVGPAESKKLWVLRSTLTLKTTDTTLMSVDGAIGQKGCSCTPAT